MYSFHIEKKKITYGAKKIGAISKIFKSIHKHKHKHLQIMMMMIDNYLVVLMMAPTKKSFMQKIIEVKTLTKNESN